jgi:hypothetical protein
MDFLDEPRQLGHPIVVGVLGTHSTLTKEQAHEVILHPLLEVLGRLPEKVLLPAEGQSSAYLSLWTERNGVDTHSIEADWRKLQKKAGILRDARIMKEATHLIVFIGPRSRSYEQTAIRQAKKGKRVFLIEPNPIEFYEIVVEDV